MTFASQSQEHRTPEKVGQTLDRRDRALHDRRVTRPRLALLPLGLIAIGCAGITGACGGGSPPEATVPDRIVGSAGFRTPSADIYCYAQWGMFWRQGHDPGRLITGLQCWVLSTAGGPYNRPKSWFLTTLDVPVSARAHQRPPFGRPLGYGKTWQGGPFRCRSATAGLRCSSILSRHGFFLSRKVQRVF
jgi:hypothetical protein